MARNDIFFAPHCKDERQVRFLWWSQVVSECDGVIRTDPQIPEMERLLVFSYIRHLGFLRALMMLLALVLALVAPLSYGGAHVDDWRVIPTVVAPALMMVLVFVILLDVMMSRIFMANASRGERARLIFIIGVELLGVVILMAAWSPLFIRIFSN